MHAGRDVDRVRNGVLLAMVLFENVQAENNSRSERLPVLRLSPCRNLLLAVATVAALALLLAGAVDAEKWARARRAIRPRRG